MRTLRIALVLAVTGTLLAQQVPTDRRIDSGDATRPKLAAEGDHVYAVWHDTRLPGSTFEKADVFFNVSADGGATWGADDVQINTNSPTLGLNESPSIVATGDDVYVAWRADGSAIRFNRSSDRGQSWLAFPRVVTPIAIPNMERTVRLVESAGALVVVWAQLGGIMSSRSTDRGINWSAPTQLNHPPPSAQSSLPLGLSVSAHGSDIVVAWIDYWFGDGGDVFVNVSNDAGTTWQSTNPRVNTDPPGSPMWRYDTDVSIFAGTACVTWLDNRNGPSNSRPDLYGNVSTDGGQTWGVSDVSIVQQAPSGPGSAGPRYEVVTTSGAILVAWHASQFLPVLVRRSLDDGASWHDVFSSAGPGSMATGRRPRIRASDDAICVTWFEAVSGSFSTDAHFDYSLDSGTTWLPSSRRFDSDAAGAAASLDLDLVAAGDAVYAAWYDFRTTGDGDGIYFNKPFGVNAAGTGTAGTSDLTPSLTVSGGALRGDVASLDLADVLGGATGAMFFGFTPATQVSIPFLGGTVYVLPTTTLPLTVPASGATSIPLAIPDDPVLSGLNLNIQGVFVDPGASGGVSMTAAAQLWIG